MLLIHHSSFSASAEMWVLEVEEEVFHGFCIFSLLDEKIAFPDCS